MDHDHLEIDPVTEVFFPVSNEVSEVYLVPLSNIYEGGFSMKIVNDL